MAQGFLDSIGVGAHDERAIIKAQQDAMFRHQNYALGQRFGYGVNGVARGLQDVTKNKDDETKVGFLTAARAGRDEAIDNHVAQTQGISLRQLEGRRKIRNMQLDPNNAEDDQGRIDILGEIVKIATEAGDLDVAGNAMRRIQEIKIENEEFNQLKTRGDVIEEAAGVGKNKELVFNGESVIGHEMVKDGVSGYLINGEFVAAGTPGLSFHDSRRVSNIYSFGHPSASASALKHYNLTSSAHNDIRQSAAGILKLTDKVSTIYQDLQKMEDAGFADLANTTAGNVVSFVGRLAHEVGGFGAAIGAAGAEGNAAMAKVRGNQGFWDNLGDNWLGKMVREAGKDKAILQSRLTELAYVIAETDDPNGRKTDKDIELALESLGAGAGSIDILKQRIAERLIGSVRNFSNYMNMFQYGDFTREQNYATLIGGSAARTFMELESDLNKSLNIEVNERGGVNINPEAKAAEQAVAATPPTAAVDGTPLPDDKFNELAQGL